MNLREVLIKVRDNGDLPDAFNMAEFLKSCGFIRDRHLGVDPESFTDQMTVEWYLGQGINIVEENAWFAMNSWLNCIEKFVPEDYEVQSNYFDDALFEI